MPNDSPGRVALPRVKYRGKIDHEYLASLKAHYAAKKRIESARQKRVRTILARLEELFAELVNLAGEGGVLQVQNWGVVPAPIYVVEQFHFYAEQHGELEKLLDAIQKLNPAEQDKLLRAAQVTAGVSRPDCKVHGHECYLGFCDDEIHVYVGFEVVQLTEPQFRILNAVDKERPRPVGKAELERLARCDQITREAAVLERKVNGLGYGRVFRRPGGANGKTGRPKAGHGGYSLRPTIPGWPPTM